MKGHDSFNCSRLDRRSQMFRGRGRDYVKNLGGVNVDSENSASIVVRVRG